MTETVAYLAMGQALDYYRRLCRAKEETVEAYESAVLNQRSGVVLFREALEQTHREWAIMQCIVANGPQTPRQVAAALGITLPSASTQMNTLWSYQVEPVRGKPRERVFLERRLETIRNLMGPTRRLQGMLLREKMGGRVYIYDLSAMGRLVMREVMP